MIGLAMCAELVGGPNADEGGITVTGLLAAFAGPNRDRIQVYPKATISGTVMQEHGAHTHKGVVGSIVELAGGNYAWAQATADHTAAAAG